MRELGGNVPTQCEKLLADGW